MLEHVLEEINVVVPPTKSREQENKYGQLILLIILVLLCFYEGAN